MQVPRRVYSQNPAMKLLLIVRDPIERIISNHAFALHRNKTRTRFDDPILEKLDDMLWHEDVPIHLYQNHEYINISTYYYHLAHWYTFFPKDQFLILDSQQLKDNPPKLLGKVERFLGVDSQLNKDLFYFSKEKGFYCFIEDGREQCMPEAKGLNHEAINRGLKHMLKWHFKPLNEKFFKLSGERFHWDS